MPVFLPQLSRREFLKRAALAGAGIAFVPHGLAAGPDKPREPETFAFFSDSHIAPSLAEYCSSVAMHSDAGACARELAAWPVRPAAVIVNGDLAYQMGKPGD